MRTFVLSPHTYGDEEKPNLHEVQLSPLLMNLLEQELEFGVNVPEGTLQQVSLLISHKS